MFKNSEVWLMLYHDGGRWTAAEVGRRLRIDQTAAGTALRAMCDFGTLQKWRREDQRVCFGVTPACKIPRGIRVKDILRAPESNQK